MPSKLLISSANRMHDIQSANNLALQYDAVVDTSGVMQRMHILRERFIRATLKGVDQWETSHKVSGHAKFIDAHTVEVN
ncbi:dihydrolipoyl dehydrogenase, partial [Klebsiella pneumoniae]|nr:dihydrolipoyl dehydrogenase [Klebsiella pneumoniae]